jgi:phosphoribosylformylglycinamidine cyclo-ligase
MELTPVKGQDLDLGNLCSRTAYDWARRTFPFRDGKPGRVEMGQATFANLMRFGDATIGITSDGIGTKVEIAERVGRFDTLGYDLVAMTADDLIANGIEPTGLSNILDVDRLDTAIVDELMRGLHDACRTARMTVTGGEIAELGNRIGGYGQRMHFNWCATAIGHLPSGRQAITGAEIRENDHVIGLYHAGFRSNGFTLARSVLARKFGEDWHHSEGPGGLSWGEILLRPSAIYAPHLHDLLTEGIPVHGLAHITGGGLSDNLGRVLRATGTGAVIENPFAPEEAFLTLQRLGGIPDTELYHSWNLNHGMLIVCPHDATARSIDFLKTAGIEARDIGFIRKTPGIIIKSRAQEGKELVYERTGK